MNRLQYAEKKVNFCIVFLRFWLCCFGANLLYPTHRRNAVPVQCQPIRKYWYDMSAVNTIYHGVHLRQGLVKNPRHTPKFEIVFRERGNDYHDVTDVKQSTPTRTSRGHPDCHSLVCVLCPVSHNIKERTKKHTCTMYIPGVFVLCNVCVHLFCEYNATAFIPDDRAVCPSVSDTTDRRHTTEAPTTGMTNQRTNENFDIIRVVDDDTVEISAPFLPVALGSTLKVRILRVDTPERGWRAECTRERELAEEATKFVVSAVYGGTWQPKPWIELDGWDKYGGRVLGKLYVRPMPLSPWMSLSQMLIDKGLGKPYNGRGAKASWC